MIPLLTWKVPFPLKRVSSNSIFEVYVQLVVRIPEFLPLRSQQTPCASPVDCHIRRIFIEACHMFASVSLRLAMSVSEVCCCYTEISGKLFREIGLSIPSETSYEQ
jgi:hypothetical protein